MRFTCGIVLTVLALLTGCGRRGADSAPSRGLPTIIPAATPLPPLPSVPAAGSTENPIVLMLVVRDVPSATPQAASLAASLSADLDLAVDVQLTDSYPEARLALCERSASMISVDAFSSLAATETGCGQVIYVLEKNGEISTHGQFIARDVFLPQSYRGVFCRPGDDSLNGWVIPALALQSRGVDAFTDFFGITDAGSDEEVVRKIDAGECGLGATTVGAEQNVRGLRFPERLRVLEELAPVPNDVLIKSNYSDPNVGTLIENAVASHSDEIAALLGGDHLQRVDPNLFVPLSSLFSAARIDPEFLSH